MISTKSIYIPLLVGILLCFLANSALTQINSIPVTNQKEILISSKILNEERTLWIHTPTDYNSTSETYPVFYLLDGEGHFSYVSEMVDYLAGYDRNRIPKMIVVAIINVDRGRDFTPIYSIGNGKTDRSRMETASGGEKFLQFIKEELVPYVDKNYRTQPYRILAGHSLGGLFAFYSKEAAPNLFQSTILISPAIDARNNKVLNDLTPFLKNHQQLSGKLFVSIGNENTQKVDSLVQQLKTSAPKSFYWRYRKYEDENHFSVTYKSMYDGIKFIYASWFVDLYDTTKRSYKDIELHFNYLSNEFGYLIKPSEELVNNFGYRQLRLGHIDNAIELFRQNTKDHPNSFNVYDSMGEAFMIKGERELAIKNYEKSLDLNPNNENGKEMLKKLKGVDK